VDGISPKLATELEVSILRKLTLRRKHSSLFVPRGSCQVHFKDYGETYWVFPLSFPPFLTHIKSYKCLQVADEDTRDCAIAMYNSSLFYWFYTAVSDCWHFGRWHMLNFPLGWDCMQDEVKVCLLDLHSQAMNDYIGNRITRFDARIGGDLYEYRISLSKPIIDEIDRVLATHYGFTDEELDFIINYDIKYRMGIGGDAEEED